jgi:UDP-N-acetylglucosamine 2-epimerase (non-hydrolysing)
MVGNTVIDALLLGQKRVVPKLIEEIELLLKPEGINILVTTHRRENFGKPLLNILKVLEDLTAKYKQLNIILPVHPNPNVKEIIHSKLAGNKQVKLISPLNYSRMIALMARVDFIMTDSGGIQEEAPTLGKPVIVLRNVTERAEGIEAGTAVIGGTEYIGIMEMADKLISDPTFYNQMAQAVNPYGDGTSSKQILEVLASA